MEDQQYPTVRNTSAALALLQDNKVSRTSGSGRAYLKFDAKRLGEWCMGANNEQRTGDVFSLDVTSLQHGWLLWSMKRPTRNLVPINQALPIPMDDIGSDSPSEARSLTGVFSDGLEFVFETSSFGGRSAVDALLADLFQRANDNSVYIHPQVKLETSHYDHAEFGKVLTPVLTAVSWWSEEGVQEGTNQIEAPEADETEEAQQAPRRRTRK